MNKNLVVYFSRKGENYFGGAIRNIVKGNTEVIAEYVKSILNDADIFEIETVNVYSSDYTRCTEEAKVELRTQARPKLKQYLSSIREYDNIYIGYPNWWGTCPMAVLTFLEHYDFKGKNIYPFCTNEGSGMGSSPRDIAKACPNAIMHSGLSLRGSMVNSSKTIVENWIKETI